MSHGATRNHEAMMSKLRSSCLVLTAAALLAADCAADSTPVMVSLVAPVQAPTWNWDVTGFRLSLLYGDCRDFAGLDIGVVARSSGEFAGVGIGGVNIANVRMRGLQIGLFNWSGGEDAAETGRSLGIQYGGINYADTFLGLQDGLVNISTGKMSGLQYGYINCGRDVVGVQCGGLIVLGVNVAYGNVEGCQIGILNYAQKMSCGVQVGILNIIADGGLFPVLPIVNGGF